jgi:hypothetical protein
VSAALEQAIKQQIARRTGGRVQMLEVELKNGEVVIRGRAPCYYLKQLALQAVLDVIGSAGATTIQHHVEVQQSAAASGGDTR